MRDYFNKEIFRAFGTIVDNKYGDVLVELYNENEGKGILFLVYDLTEKKIDELSMEERKSHVIFNQSYDISDVNFNNEMSVLEKIRDLAFTFDIDINN